MLSLVLSRKLCMGSIPTIFLLSAASALLAIIGFVVVRRLVKPIDLNEHQGFLDATLNIVGTLVSILLGLLVAAALDHYRTLEQSIDTEAASVSQVYRLSGGLPSEARTKIRALCAQYSMDVLDDEWPLMAQGKSSDKAFKDYVQIVTAVVLFHPHDDGESNLHSALITAMQQIGDCRRERILVLHSNWTSQLMPLLIMCSAIVLGFAYLYVRRGALLHSVLICFVAVALGGNLGLVFLLSNPFSGDWQIKPRGFELNKKLLQEINSPEYRKLIPNDP